MSDGAGGAAGSQREHASFQRGRLLVLRGLGWNAAFQGLEALVSLSAMLVMVRLVSPAEYGRFAALGGILALTTALSCSGLCAQAVQLPDDAEPDWSAHAAAALLLQTALALAALLLAGLLGHVASYAPIAPLLRLAAIGLVLDAPCQLSTAMLRRNLDFRRLRILTGLGAAANATVSIALASTGHGATSLVAGLCIASPLPAVLDLLLVRRFRPRRGWLRPPSLASYGPALRFWMRQAGSWMLHNAREAIASGVLPRTLGFAPMGLLGRAQALFAMSVERVLSVLVDSVYPLLPRFAHVAGRLGRGVTLLVQAVALVLVPSIAVLAIEGSKVSRLVFGPRWIAMDPLIAPAAIAVLARAAIVIASTSLLAANRLAATLRLDFVSSLLTIAPLALPLAGVALVPFAWASAGAQAAAAIIYFAGAADLLERGWARRALWPPAIATAAAALATLGLDAATVRWPLPVELAAAVAVFSIIYFAALRLAFPRALVEIIGRLPRGERWLRALGLPALATAAILNPVTSPDTHVDDAP